jgi:hypothetical protein
LSSMRTGSTDQSSKSAECMHDCRSVTQHPISNDSICSVICQLVSTYTS